MSAYPSSSNFRTFKILSRAFKLRAWSVNLLYPFGVCQENLCHRRNLKTKDKSGIQAVKKLKPLKVVALRKNTSRFAPNYEKQNASQQLPGIHDEEFDAYEDELALAASKYSSKMAAHHAEAEFTKSLVRGVRTVRHQTIKKKYFRQPPSPDLLTWAAKEQIRYLHSTNPEDWPVDVLLEHFPVNEVSLKRILKDNRKWFQEEDILKHDKRILETWNNLLVQIESGDVSEGDSKDFLKCFFSSQHECLVQNATSLPTMPYPQRYSKLRKPGPLSAIVQDCLQIQAKETEVLLKEKIPSVTDQISSKLQEIAFLLDNKASQSNTIQENNIMTRLPETDVTNLSKHRSHHMYARGEARSSGYSMSITKGAHLGKEKPSLSGTYIKDKSVYDENGKFLYKIP